MPKEALLLHWTLCTAKSLKVFVYPARLQGITKRRTTSKYSVQICFRVIREQRAAFLHVTCSKNVSHLHTLMDVAIVDDMSANKEGRVALPVDFSQPTPIPNVTQQTLVPLILVALDLGQPTYDATTKKNCIHHRDRDRPEPGVRRSC